ncbi:alpha/beta hydrolase family protein [Saccharothrix algeriensis]|uniref:Esterase n=2 Tax=Saccharothrix algeriensis TaxID=173560 RepID=A0ABS2SEL2_9PSEU|nr:prolyl oligopeptidase family serine peptidase [Saccharothrix algeriensis]MBM7814698.1 putative esterase [Saccharothrix algeriensis]
MDRSPDPHVWAVVSAPVHPSIADNNAAAVSWRGVRLDPDLAGVPPSPLRIARVEITHPGGDTPWAVQVESILGTGLAWHPELPLVAGLAVRDRRAYPWVADYRAGTVRRHPHMRSALSLTALGEHRLPPIAWCGADLLAVLLPAGAAEQPAGTAPPTRPPIVHEATGPGYVVFDEAPAELVAMASARVAVADPRTGEVAPLSDPLLVRELSPAPSGAFLLVDHVLDRASGRAHPDGMSRATSLWEVPAPGREGTRAESLPAGARWALGRCDALSWPASEGSGSRVRIGPARGDGQWFRLPHGSPRDSAWWPIRHRGAAHVLVDSGGSLWLVGEREEIRLTRPDAGFRLVRAHPSARTGSTGEFAFDCAFADDRRGVAVLDLAGRSVTAIPAGHPPPPTGHRPAPATRESPGARLTYLPGEGTLLLWLRGFDAGSGLPQRPTTPLVPGEWPGAVLDLVMRWPTVGGPEAVHDDVVTSVRNALNVLAQEHGHEYNGSVVVGGHSFGATLALHALAHVPGFSAAIVHSGCYNRTRTPTGFQFERRSLWEAPSVYDAFSALRTADRLDRPVLIVHGLADTNPATPPDQAVELYRGIVANGGTARMVLIPDEEHNLRHFETQRTLLQEHRQWLMRWGSPSGGDGRGARTGSRDRWSA